MKSVLAFGEILWDLLPSGQVLGGAPFNFAYRFFSQGGRVRISSRLGRDNLGEQAIGIIEGFGLDTSLIQWDTQHATGTVPVTVDSNGVPDFTILPDVAYDHIDPLDELLKSASVSDCISFGTLIQRTQTSRQTLAGILEASPKSLKFLDINLRRDCYSYETVLSSLRSTDILKLNEDEVFIVAGLLGMKSLDFFTILDGLLDRYDISYCLVTLGAEGVFALSHDAERLYIPGWDIDVVDTVGSGDAFSAGFLHSWLTGLSFRESCTRGNCLGAAAAMTQGGTTVIMSDMLESINDERRARNVRTDFERYS